MRNRELSRRDAVKLLGMGGTGLGVLTTVGKRVAAADAWLGSSAPPAAPTRAIVRTILKDVTPDSITGATLIHEHLSFGNDASALNFYNDVDLIAAEVKACVIDGVSCIVDTGTLGLGRHIDNLRTIATRSGVLVVACGGFHVKSDYPPDIFHKTEDQIADDLFASATAERWGAIGEMGTGTAVPMDPDERKAFRAAAKLHARSGLSIITHVSDGCAQCALDQVDLFESAGVNLNHVVIGHLNDIKDQPTAAPLAIARRGAYLGFDHSGRPDDPRLQEYVRTIMAMLEAGHEDRVCLSSDFASQKYLRKNGGPGIAMVMTTMVPRLRQAGVSDAMLHKILVENPRRALAFVPRTG
jgi:phosphotriesterase-related protein